MKEDKAKKKERRKRLPNCCFSSYVHHIQRKEDSEGTKVNQLVHYSKPILPFFFSLFILPSTANKILFSNFVMNLSFQYSHSVLNIINYNRESQISGRELVFEFMGGKDRRDELYKNDTCNLLID